MMAQPERILQSLKQVLGNTNSCCCILKMSTAICLSHQCGGTYSVLQEAEGRECEDNTNDTGLQKDVAMLSFLQINNRLLFRLVQIMETSSSEGYTRRLTGEPECLFFFSTVVTLHIAAITGRPSCPRFGHSVICLSLFHVFLSLLSLLCCSSL